MSVTLSVDQVAAELGCPVAVVFELIRLGHLAARVVPQGDGTYNTFRILTADMEDYLVECCPGLAALLQQGAPTPPKPATCEQR